MVVACRTGTGCTTTAALLGATLAEGKGSRVLIIDGNFRTPSMNMVFQLKNNGGFSDIITQGLPFEASIQPTNRKNLFVLTTGQISMVPAELFEGETIDKLLSTLSKQFDFIIFDSAPLLEYPDSYALAPKVDCVILVVGAEKTSIEDARRAKRDLERAGGQTLGVVLNRKRDYRPPFIKKFFAGLG
jgi:capsular exopolysaccharide synthesis family protein